MDQEPVRVDAIGRAGHQRAEVLPGPDGASVLHLIGLDHLDVVDLVLVGVTEHVQDDGVTDGYLVEVVEHARGRHARVPGDDAVAGNAAHGQGRPFQVPRTCRKHLIGRPMSQRLPDADGGQLDPPHRLVAAPGELALVGRQLSVFWGVRLDDVTGSAVASIEAAIVLPIALAAETGIVGLRLAQEVQPLLVVGLVDGGRERGYLTVGVYGAPQVLDQGVSGQDSRDERDRDERGVYQAGGCGDALPALPASCRPHGRRLLMVRRRR